MGITGVIRGDDLLDTTGQQLYLYKTLQQCYPQNYIEVPKYGHAPLLVDADGHRLSKRQKRVLQSVNYEKQQWSAIQNFMGISCRWWSYRWRQIYSSREINLSELIEFRSIVF